VQPESLRIGLLNYSGDIWLPTSGVYQVVVQPVPIPEHLEGELPVRIGEQSVILRADPENHRYIADSVALNEGNISLSIRQITVGGHYQLRFSRNGTLPLFDSTEPSSVEQIASTPTSHEIIFENSGPAVLVFHESYFPLWTAADQATGEIFGRHFIANGFGNGFLIEKPGKRTIRIAYSVQDRFLAGWRVALLATVFCLIGALLLLIKRTSKQC
jgi:hypothetical protein